MHTRELPMNSKHKVSLLSEEALKYIKSPQQHLVLAILLSAIDDNDIDFIKSKGFEVYCVAIGMNPHSFRRLALKEIENVKKR